VLSGAHAASGRHVSTWVHAVFRWESQLVGGSLTILTILAMVATLRSAILPTDACTETEESLDTTNHCLHRRSLQLLKPAHPCYEANHFSCEAQHDCVVSEPYHALAFVVATHVFSGLVWLVVITRALTQFCCGGYPLDLGAE
jgi:hypothetical protein